MSAAVSDDLDDIDESLLGNKIDGVLMWLPDGYVDDEKQMRPFKTLAKWIKDAIDINVTVLLSRVDEQVVEQVNVEVSSYLCVCEESSILFFKDLLFCSTLAWAPIR